MQCLLTGQAGVWQVASQLALRGLNPYFPGVDLGCDLLVEGRIRLQVKAASLRKHERVYPEGAYHFKFWQAAIVTGSNTIRRRGQRDYSTCVDYVVLWGVDENRFWIVPASLLAHTSGIVVGPRGFYQRQDFAEARTLRAAGLSQQEIADRLGISQVAVSYQLRGGRTKQPKRTVAAQVRELENRWDLIMGALATLTEANAVAGPAPAPARAGVEPVRLSEG